MRFSYVKYFANNLCKDTIFYTQKSGIKTLNSEGENIQGYYMLSSSSIPLSSFSDL
ncbi:MAG: hypothetical protein LBE36_11665 [Flavobacteriaceae bacterium]|nr:hypothetical protein [Flavobacteriaceae bacterium]